MSDPTPGAMPTPLPIPPDVAAMVESLSLRAVDSTPVHHEWSPETWLALASPEAGGWDYTEARRCDECGAAVIYPDDHRAELVNVYGDPVTDDDGEPITATGEDDRDEWVELVEAHEDAEDGPYAWRGCENGDGDARDMGAEGPMMNYYYPAGIDSPEDAARKLADTCLCVVEVDGLTGLALTGGGMDLSWEIVGAFVALGMLPPAHFAHLPHMANRRTATVDTVTALAACLRSVDVVARRAEQDRRHLADFLAGLHPVEVEA